MDTKLGHKTLYWIYNLFNDYFNNGDLVIAGSFYYKRLGCDIPVEYNDVDLVVDTKRDDIFHEIMDHIKPYNPASCFRESFDGEPIIGAFRIDGYLGVDILRNDFSNLSPRIEIIPDVWSYGLSDKILADTYEHLELNSPKDNQKYKQIKEFFHERTMDST